MCPQLLSQVTGSLADPSSAVVSPCWLQWGPGKEGWVGAGCYEIPLLDFSSFDLRFNLMGTAPEKGDLLSSPHSEGVSLILLGKGALDPLLGLKG